MPHTTTARRAATTTGIALMTVTGLFALAGCAGSDEPTDAATPSDAATSSAAAPSPSETESASDADASGALSEDELATIFTGIQFVPDEYASTGEMLESIYPGLTVSDASCLIPFGAGWETLSEDATVEYGTSNDRSMTSVVVSAADETVAETLAADTADAIERCADGQELFSMQGAPVTTTVTPIDLAIEGAEEAQGWQVTGDVGGTPFSLVGATVRNGGDALALVGWDPETNTDYVPMATQMFVDRLAAARG